MVVHAFQQRNDNALGIKGNLTADPLYGFLPRAASLYSEARETGTMYFLDCVVECRPVHFLSYISVAPVVEISQYGRFGLGRPVNTVYHYYTI